jgi:diacylglycerol kinase (ATP)
LNLILVFNPHAAFGRAAALLPRIMSALEAFASVRLLRTSRAGEAEERVAGTDLRPYDGLIAAGGDGTLFEVVNGLCAHEPAGRIPLGVIPVGTGNAFARDLGLMPGDWRRAVKILQAGHTRRVDAGRAETQSDTFHFLNIVGAGLPVDAMITASRLKFLGRSAYSVATLWQALRMQSYPFSLELDGTRLEQESMFVEISNTRYTGTSFLIAPEAELDDGLFDVTLVTRLSRIRLLRLFPTIYRGRHVGHPEVVVRRARRITIDAPGRMTLAPDGELRGVTPVTITCLQKHLEIFC